jgi:ABC-type antimicrobial peptide transport system permease subunit
VSESFVRRYFQNHNPIGAHIGMGNRPDTKATIEIIGVVKDFSRRTLRDEQVETIFLQYFDNQSGDGRFYIRIRGSAERAFGTIRSAIAQVDPELSVELTMFNDQIEQSLRTERMLASLSSAFGTLALMLAVIGLYGIMAFVVTLRTQEIGVRMALGATSASVFRLVLGQALRLAVIGVAAGLLAAALLTRLLERLLYDVEPLDPSTFVVTALVLLVVASVASYVPARRAMHMAPVDALRTN